MTANGPDFSQARVSDAPVTEDTVSIARDESEDALGVFIVVVPNSTQGDARDQFVSMASQAERALRSQCLEPSDIVSGWIRFAQAPHWSWRDDLSKALNTSSALPITGLVQPPAPPSRKCVLELQAVKGAGRSRVVQSASPHPVASSVLRRGAKHLRLMSVVPRGDLRTTANFVELAYDMFAQAGQALAAHGLTFSNIVRTWIHVSCIESNYAALNSARNRYFQEQGLARLPASTCVEGTPVGVASPVAMDLYAVSAHPDVQLEALGSETMGEASAYGVAFSRAIRLNEPGMQRLFISGTASIDIHGNVVSAGDLHGQLACMFRNVRSLLDEARLGFADVLSATAYLKHAEYLDVFVEAARVSGLDPKVPCAVVATNICRPEWLCEIELFASRVR